MDNSTGPWPGEEEVLRADVTVEDLLLHHVGEPLRRLRNGRPKGAVEREALGARPALFLAWAAALSRRCHRKSSTPKCSQLRSLCLFLSERLLGRLKPGLAPKVLLEAAPREDFEDQELRAPELHMEWPLGKSFPFLLQSFGLVHGPSLQFCQVWVAEA